MRRILIIDDEEDICLSLKFVLEDTGDFEVHTETDGLKALEVTQEVQPDVIILDLMIKDVDGFSVAKDLKNFDKTKNIPIILLSALPSNEQMEQRARELSIYKIVTKPVTLERLIELIEKTIGNTK